MLLSIHTARQLLRISRRLLVILIASQFALASATEPKRPTFAAAVLAEQFPEFKGDVKSLTDLRRHRRQLEFFREHILEGYNRGLKKYLETLLEYDRLNELRRSRGEITTAEYDEAHQYVLVELKNASASGPYLEAYGIYLAKYRAEAGWLIPAIKAAERSQVRF